MLWPLTEILSEGISTPLSTPKSYQVCCHLLRNLSLFIVIVFKLVKDNLVQRRAYPCERLCTLLACPTEQ
jgi:hypothetical protein